MIPIQVPTLIDLAPYCSKNVTKTKFRLKSITTHIGSSLEHGHYIAALRHGDRWEIANDAKTQVAPEEAALSLQPYIVSYEKIEQEEAPAIEVQPESQLVSDLPIQPVPKLASETLTSKLIHDANEKTESQDEERATEETERLELGDLSQEPRETSDA